MEQPRQLPLEIVIAIVGYALDGAGIQERGEISGLLGASRTTYALVSERLYCTAVLYSSRMANRFIDALAASTRLSELTVNLWVASLGFEAFSYQLGSSTSTVVRILALTPNLRRLALPSQYFPRLSSLDALPPIKHLTISEDVFPPSTPELPALKTIHIHGPLWPTRVETIISRCPNLQYLICTIPYTSQTYVTPAAQCAETLLNQLPSLVLIQFASSRRVTLALQKLLATQLDHKRFSSRISIKALAIDEESPCEKWCQEISESFQRQRA